MQIPVVDLLAGCCGWVVNEDGYVLRSVGDWLCVKRDLGVGT